MRQMSNLLQWAFSVSMNFRLVVAGLAFVTGPAHGHDIYANVTNRFGFNCCNGQDCRPAPYRATASGVLFCRLTPPRCRT